MKKLHVTLKLEMSVPDDWELVETSEGTPVLKLPNGQFMDMAVEPLFASDPVTSRPPRRSPLWLGDARLRLGDIFRATDPAWA